MLIILRCGMLLLVKSLVVATDDVVSIIDDIERKSIWHFLKFTSLQFIMLQETHSSPKIAKLLQMEWGGNILSKHGNNGCADVAIAFKRDFK